jgi:hypothetical protein
MEDRWSSHWYSSLALTIASMLAAMRVVLALHLGSGSLTSFSIGLGRASRVRAQQDGNWLGLYLRRHIDATGTACVESNHGLTTAQTQATGPAYRLRGTCRFQIDVKG